MIFSDYRSYIQAQEAVNRTYSDKKKWNAMSILNTANMGNFSTDRTIREYAKDIWNVQGVPVTMKGVNE